MSDITGPILVIDDEASFRDEFKEMLENSGYKDITCLDSGQHCIRFIENQRWNWSPSLVFTDIVMDGMGGYQLMRRIAEHYPSKEIPFIVISKLYTPEDRVEAELAGASAFLRKPLAKDKLIAAIKKATTKKEIKSEEGDQVF